MPRNREELSSPLNMKKHLSLLIFLIFIGYGSHQGYALGLHSTNYIHKMKYFNAAPDNSGSNRSADIRYNKFELEAKKNNIAHRKATDLAGISGGYYIVAGVFGDQRNARKSVATLKKIGLAGQILFNPKNKLNYVYLNYNSDWRKVLAPCISKFDGKYPQKVWILFVENRETNVHDTVVNANPQEAAQKNSNTPTKTIFNNDSLVVVAKRNKIALKTVGPMEGVEEGQYVIAGVYSNENNAKISAKKLKKKGFDSGVILNPENNNSYVYMYRSSDWHQAIAACLNQFEGKYKDPVWILNIELPEAKTIVPIEEVSLNTLNELSEEPLVVQSQNSPIKSKLLQKADEYFNKMWYAEAAKLYEEGLKNDEGNFSYDIIQKVADAHYFNTNMERAYYWYDLLYSKFASDMSADNLFKYANSLKGTGRFAKAKRLMRLYDRKQKVDQDSGNSDSRTTAARREVVLDNLLENVGNFDVKNMAINSQYSDFAPMFFQKDQVVFASAMDSSIFNTRRYKWNDQPYLDLYVAKINEESQDLKEAIKFSKKINTKYHEAAVTFSPDNNTMYFTRNNYGKKLKRDKKGVNNLKIYVSRKVDGEWTEASELPFNSDDYSTGHPALSPDGKKLYFVSDMPGSLGETDIFVVDVLGNNSFSDPRNLGPKINTERKEMFPFMTDKKLYFSSDGHSGMGGLDVYEVAYDENGFQEVVNAGQPINSNKDDFSYIVDEATQKGYFASNRRGGKGDDDIYSFKKLVIDEIPVNKNAIAGVVTELVTGDIMPHALVQLLDENNIKLKEVETADDGSFVFEDLVDDTKYSIKMMHKNYFDEELSVTTTKNDTINVAVSMRRLQEMIAIEDGIKKLKTEMIHFDFDKSFIRPDASKELDKLVAVMNEYPNMVIKIESHTDSRGTRAYNRYLSDKRAKSTRDYIISKGIAPKRIESAIGYGEDRLLNECNGAVRCTEAKHYLNRRSEFIIVKN
jgi:outer membrane protein OmpA-like peptidoglycan-associated protein